MPRFFTLQQAQKLLPEVESAMREAIAIKSEYQQAVDAWQDSSRRIAMMGGIQVDRSKMLERKQQREANAHRLKAAIEKIQEFGCLVKDLGIGLIDFPTLLNGVEVYLCWKLGEAGIQFWHGVEEGFRGRRPIDADFLAHHRGERPN
jgi:hypothetical protein